MARIVASVGNFLSKPFVNAHTISLSVFLFLYLCTFRYLQSVAWQDPGSVFFDPDRGFEKGYSLDREREGNDFIDAASASREGRTFPKASSSPSFCVGIATVQREGARYFKTAVGSLLDGLSKEEREDVYMLNFIANVDPSVHQAYSEQWLYDLSDQVLTYSNATGVDIERLKDLEKNDPSFSVKPILDYIHLLEACQSTGADYFLIIEDDVLAADGWYHRTKAGVRALEKTSDKDTTVYLRLFYNERLLGWNSELWLSYTLWSAWIFCLVVATLLVLYKFHAPSSKFLTAKTNATILFVCTPLCLALYFAAGRLTVSPLPTGINRMDAFGCCSQAFLFPAQQVPPLISYWEQEGSGMIDTLTEQYANARGLPRYALTPSVFQHVGTKSSKFDRPSMWNRNGAQNIWNWSFERFDSGVLEREHEAVLDGTAAGGGWRFD